MSYRHMYVGMCFLYADQGTTFLIYGKELIKFFFPQKKRMDYVRNDVKNPSDPHQQHRCYLAAYPPPPTLFLSFYLGG